MNFLALPPDQRGAGHVDTPEAALQAPAPPTCFEFHPAGHLLAAGMADGGAVVWDFTVRSICRRLRPSSVSGSVLSLAWGADGGTLVTVAADPGRCLVVWDVLAGTVRQRVPLAEADGVRRVRGHPSAPEGVLSGSGGCAVLRWGDGKAAERLPVAAVVHADGPGVCGACADALYADGGNLLLCATDRGRVVVVARGDLSTPLAIVPVTTDQPSPAITALCLSAKGRRLLVHTEAFLRVYDVAGAILTPSPAPQLTGPTHVLTACFAGQYAGHGADSEYLYVATRDAILVFEAVTGRPVLGLDAIPAPADGLRAHPFAPLLVSHHPQLRALVVWTRRHQMAWSRFSPAFTDLRATTEYIDQEREDDLDLDDPGPAPEASSDEEGPIDLVTIDDRTVPFVRQLCHPGFHPDGDPKPLAAEVRGKAKPKPKPARRGRPKAKRRITAGDEDSDDSGESSDSDFEAPVRATRRSQRVLQMLGPGDATEGDGGGSASADEWAADGDSGSASDRPSAAGVDLRQLADII